MNRVKIGQKIVTINKSGFVSTYMLCVVPDTNKPENMISVNLIHMSTGNRWSDELFTVDVLPAYRDGLSLDFIKNEIIDLEGTRVVEIKD